MSPFGNKTTSGQNLRVRQCVAVRRGLSLPDKSDQFSHIVASKASYVA